MSQLTYYPTAQLTARAHVATADVHHESLGFIRLETNVPLSHAVESKLVNELLALYPEGISETVQGTMVNVSCGLFMAQYETVNYTATPF